METRPLGRSGIQVSKLCLGTMTFGGGEGMWRNIGALQQEEADGLIRTAIDAATAAEEEGKSLEVVDLRTLSPFDLDPVFASVRKTGRLVVVHEAPGNVGLGAEIAARVQQECFYSLESPVLRVTGFDTPYPPARLEEEFLPDLDRILDAVVRHTREGS